MESFKGLWEYCGRLFSSGGSQGEDSEAILAEARETMERELAKMKEPAIAAIGRRNMLRNKLAARHKQLFDPERETVDTEIAKRLGVSEKLPRDPEHKFVDPSTAELTRAVEKAEREAAVFRQRIVDLETRARRRATDRLTRLPDWTRERAHAELNKALAEFRLGV